jgi:hypothetical protein
MHHGNSKSDSGTIYYHIKSFSNHISRAITSSRTKTFNIQRTSTRLLKAHDTFNILQAMAPHATNYAAEQPTPQASTATSTQRVAQLTGHLSSPAETQRAKNHPDLNIPYPVSKFKIDPQRHIDRVREIKVAVIGAGLSGISAGILLPAKVPGIQLTIFEKNSDVVCFPIRSSSLHV